MIVFKMILKSLPVNDIVGRTLFYVSNSCLLIMMFIVSVSLIWNSPTWPQISAKNRLCNRICLGPFDRSGSCACFDFITYFSVLFLMNSRQWCFGRYEFVYIFVRSFTRIAVCIIIKWLRWWFYVAELNCDYNFSFLFSLIGVK